MRNGFANHHLFTRSLVSSLWSVGWAPLVVVVLHSGLAAAIGHQREYDPAFHFLGGAAGAYCLLRVLSVFRVNLGQRSRQRPLLIVLVAMVGVTVVWEVIEFTSDHFLGTHVRLGAGDTATDILIGLLGALILLAAAALVGRMSSLSGSNAG